VRSSLGGVDLGRSGVAPTARYESAVEPQKDAGADALGVAGARRSRSNTDVGNGNIDVNGEYGAGYDDRFSLRNGSISSRLSQLSRGSIDDTNIHYIFGNRTNI